MPAITGMARSYRRMSGIVGTLFAAADKAFRFMRPTNLPSLPASSNSSLSLQGEGGGDMWQRHTRHAGSSRTFLLLAPTHQNPPSNP